MANAERHKHSRSSEEVHGQQQKRQSPPPLGEVEQQKDTMMSPCKMSELITRRDAKIFAKFSCQGYRIDPKAKVVRGGSPSWSEK